MKSIFHDSRIPLQKWFLAIAMFLHAKKGISAKHLEREPDISYPTAWRILYQIGKAMGDSNNRELFTNRDIHTNSMERFLAVLKIGIHGIYHHVSIKYLQRYADKFTFRYNNRDKIYTMDIFEK